jgi:cell fate regulator YaaT (PSP1 superfamily)
MNDVLESRMFETDMADLSSEDLAALEDSGQETEGLASVAAVYPEPLYRLKLDYSSESVFAFVPEGPELVRGDFVVIPTRYGLDLARVLGLAQQPIGVSEGGVVTIECKATEGEIKRMEALKTREKDASRVFQEKAVWHGLDMKLITTHCLYDESKMLFFFSAESRVDFRELVKDLVSVFHTRIELRQIGVRDESRIIGGLGMCDRCLCCHGVSDKQRPVTIRMAKEQSLSLNSLKISGQCGRLMCCLAYEYDWYTEARSNMPPEGLLLSYDGISFRVTGLNLLTGVVQISGEDGRVLEIPVGRFSQQNGKWHIDK